MGKKRIIEKGGEESSSKGQVSVQGTSKKAGSASLKRRLGEGRLYILSSYNNTMVNVTDVQGNTLAIISAGALGFKGARKATPFAASKVIDGTLQVLSNRGIERVDVFVKGIGPGRDSSLRSLANKQVEILSIKDITGVPHNGPRAKKVRRV